MSSTKSRANHPLPCRTNLTTVPWTQADGAKTIENYEPHFFGRNLVCSHRGYFGARELMDAAVNFVTLLKVRAGCFLASAGYGFCMPSVLAVGLDPSFADYSQMPNLTPDLVRSFIDAQLARLRTAGYEVESCLVDLGETAEAVMTRFLTKQKYDCVMVGAGLRAAPQLPLFERLLNLIHAQAPQAKICFNNSPADSLEAVQRWV